MPSEGHLLRRTAASSGAVAALHPANEYQASGDKTTARNRVHAAGSIHSIRAVESGRQHSSLCSALAQLAYDG